MENSTSFVSIEPTMQFLSIITYINTLSDILYVENFLQQDEQCQPFPVINALYLYLNQGNERKRKRQLIRKILQDTVLYGGRANETLDRKYIDATFEYIISNVVFSQYGNVYGYLAKVVSSASNLTASSLRVDMFHKLEDVSDINENGKISHLHFLTRLKISETILWPLFPRPKRKMDILEIDYIYAQAGLILARSAGLNIKKIRFKKYITLSLPLQLMALENETDQSLLQIFSLPALLYYAHKEKRIFQRNNIAILISSGDFWSEVFKTLFSFLNSTFEGIHSRLKENNFYQFQLAMSNFKNRTVMAEEILREKCPGKTEEEYETAVSNYKLFSVSFCSKTGKSLEDLNEVYSKQVDEVKEKYRGLMKDFLQKAFHDANLIGKINSSLTGVFSSYVTPIPIPCVPIACLPFVPKIKENVNLITIRQNGAVDLYALILNQNNMSLIRYNDDRKKFVETLKLPEDTTFETAGASGVVLKRPSESFEVFKDRVAERIASTFRTNLYNFGYDETLAEKVIDILLSFVPFYHCVTYAKASRTVEATFACFQDVISLIPLAGQLSKITSGLITAGAQSLLKTTGMTLGTFTLGQAFRLTAKVGFRGTLHLADSIKSVIFTKQMFRSLSLSVIRAVDPGFELGSIIIRKGGKELMKVFSKLLKTAKKFPALGLELGKVRGVWGRLIAKGEMKIDMGSLVIGEMQGHQVFRYINPQTMNPKPFGPKYIRLRDGNAELRMMIGFKEEVPVVVSRVARWGKVYYKRIDLVTEKSYGIEWTLNENNLLRPTLLPFREHITKIVREGLSGRGKLRKEKNEQLNKAVKIMTDSRDISTNAARRILKQYMLTVKLEPRLDASNLDSLSEANLMEFDADKQLDVNDPNVIKELLGDNSGLDMNLNQEIVGVPTYEDFALDWSRYEDVHERYREWYLPDSREISRVIYNDRFDSPGDYDMQTTNARFQAIYGQDFEKQLGLKTMDVSRQYYMNDAARFVGFEDFFAIEVWVKNGHNEAGLSDTSKLRSRIALFKLTIRQAHEDYFQSAGKLFRVEMMDPSFVEKEIAVSAGGSLVTNRFMISTTDGTTAAKYLDFIKRVIDNSQNERNKVPVFYEIELDSKYLVANMDTVLSSFGQEVAILPNMEFHVDEAKSKLIDGKVQWHVKMHNKPQIKEIWLLRVAKSLMSSRKKLNELTGTRIDNSQPTLTSMKKK